MTHKSRAPPSLRRTGPHRLYHTMSGAGSSPAAARRPPSPGSPARLRSRAGYLRRPCYPISPLSSRPAPPRASQVASSRPLLSLRPQLSVAGGVVPSDVVLSAAFRNLAMVSQLRRRCRRCRLCAAAGPSSPPKKSSRISLSRSCRTSRLAVGIGEHACAFSDPPLTNLDNRLFSLLLIHQPASGNSSMCCPRERLAAGSRSSLYSSRIYRARPIYITTSFLHLGAIRYSPNLTFIQMKADHVNTPTHLLEEHLTCRKNAKSSPG